MSEIDDFIRIIEEQMNSGVSRLKVSRSDELGDNEVQRVYHHGRCDVGSPWAKGTVTNCDAVDLTTETDIQ